MSIDSTSTESRPVAPASLHRGKALRGCIGAVEASQPIFRAVHEPDELDHLIIEISVLGAPRAVRSPDEIAIGVDGLRVELGPQRGLLLPQVATEAAWDAATFLARTCVKAGLPEDAWREAEAEILAFPAQVFSDTTHPAPKKK